MQILQIQQIVNQAQTQTSSSNAELVKPASSFADELKAAENRSKSSDEKLSSRDERVKPSDSERPVQKEEKDQRIAEKEDDSSVSENSADKRLSKEPSEKETLSKNERESGEEALAVENQIAIVQRMTEDSSLTVRMVADQDDSEAISELELNDARLGWLFDQNQLSSEKSELPSDDDLSKLLENVQEFIPGNESDEEKLENAQNLVASDPEKFLNQIQNLQNQVARADQEDDSSKKSQPVEAPKAKKSGFHLEVKDYRTEKNASDASSEKIAQKIADKKSFNAAYAEGKSSGNELTMELVKTAQQNSTSANAQVAASDGSTFQSQLAQAVQENAPEFVKAGTVVLKDNNKGSINLILHPESLGNVKVHLSVSDKLITGTISVQSREAYEAFKESISSIKEAFAQSGFETGSFDLNFSDSSQGQFAQGQNSDGSQMAQFKGRNAYGDFVTPQQFFEDAQSEYDESSSYGVNIVA